MTFYGYRRPDGRVGVRNKVLILPTSVCASDTARIISQQVEGSVTFNNQQGCSQVAVDQQLTMDVMAGYAANPNIYGTVLVSLGCIHKGGHSIINEVYDYGKQVKAREGLVIMDTPGNDPASVAAMAAGGAQVVVFSSGRGSPIGSPIVPVIKITGNKITFANMEDNIDFNAAPLIYGERTVEELGQDLLAMVVETANGRQTKAEALGYTETAIARLCNYV